MPIEFIVEVKDLPNPFLDILGGVGAKHTVIRVSYFGTKLEFFELKGLPGKLFNSDLFFF